MMNLAMCSLSWVLCEFWTGFFCPDRTSGHGHRMSGHEKEKEVFILFLGARAARFFRSSGIGPHERPTLFQLIPCNFEQAYLSYPESVLSDS